MSSSSAIQAMQNEIMKYIKKNIPDDLNKAHLGRIDKNQVTIDNKSYPYVVSVDRYVGNGDYVYCLLPDNRNVAVIVGTP